MIIVAGKAKVKPGALDAVREIMEATIRETRKEAGCIDYSYGQDVLDPDTILIVEFWQTHEALKAHFAAPHMAAWMKALGEAGVVSQDIKAYDIAGERSLMG